MPNTDAGGFCCDECFVPSHDDYKGFATPDYCGDLECECHDPVTQSGATFDIRPALIKAAVKAVGLAILAAVGMCVAVAFLSDSPNTPMHVARVK